MTEAAVKYVAERILRVQDILGKRLGCVDTFSLKIAK